MNTETPKSTKRPLSSEGTEIDHYPANLEQQQQQTIDTYQSRLRHGLQSAHPETSGQTGRYEGGTHGGGGPLPPSTSNDTPENTLASMTVGTDTSSTSNATQSGAGSRVEENTSVLLPPRQVIAVSASKSPAAFFNLARKFLVSNEMCDLSALEGAIVSAVDAAHLLERSKLASIIRIQTSYVNVEPKRKKQVTQQEDQDMDATVQQSSSDSTKEDGSIPQAASGGNIDSSSTGRPPSFVHGGQNVDETSRQPSDPTPSQSRVQAQTPGTAVTSSSSSRPERSSGSREMRRARIVITVRRTENYKRWLEENPLQAMIATEGGKGEDDDDDEDGTGDAEAASVPTTTTPAAFKNLKRG